LRSADFKAELPAGARGPLRTSAGHHTIDAHEEEAEAHSTTASETGEKAPEKALAAACLSLLDAGLVDEAQAILRVWIAR
jgi:hypothetical protein